MSVSVFISNRLISWFNPQRKITLKTPWLLIVLGVLYLGLSLPFPKVFAQPVKPEQAFSHQVQFFHPDLIEVRFKTIPGYYLYKDKFKFRIEPVSLKIGAPQFPAGQIKEDPYFGKQEIFRGESRIKIPVSPVPPTGTVLTLFVSYQGCADSGLCYPPKTQTIKFSIPPQTAPENQPLPGGEKGKASDSSRILMLMGSNSISWILLCFFGFGLLLSLTPCVFPMVPIISSLIVAQGEKITKRRGFFLSLTYVLGMALTYSLVGVLAGLSGRLFTSALQNPWVLGAFALIFVILALSMFGFFDLQVPSVLQKKMTSASNQRKAGTFWGVLLMGIFSAIIVGPCVSAPLAGALVYISQTGNVWLGGSALFALSWGMGVPLLIIGTSAGVLLPKTGAWMEKVKYAFGVLLLATGLWMLSPVLSAPLQLGLWGAFLIVLAIYLQAIDPLPLGSSGITKFGKGLGVIALVLGIFLLIGALRNGNVFFQLLSPTQGESFPKGEPSSPKTTGLPFEKLTTLPQLESRLKENQGQKTLLFFSAEWCISCKEMKLLTFENRQVQEKLQKGWNLLQADVTETNEATNALLKRFGLFGPPAVLFFDEQGKEIPENRVIGYQKAEEFLIRIETVK
jgi:thiol:disulfide interchange protein DsbD